MDEEKLKSIRDEYLTRSDKVDYSLDLPEGGNRRHARAVERRRTL